MEEIFKEYKDKLPLKIIDDIKAGLPAKVAKAKVKKIFEMVYDEYERSKVHAGESVGVVSAESMGEPGTQMTLNTFHFAGVSEMNVTLGLPRIIEILDARKVLSTPMMEIYLTAPYNKGKDIKKIASTVKETKAGDVVDEFMINIIDSVIEVKVNEDRMNELEIKEDVFIKALQKDMKGFLVKKTKEGIFIRPRGKDKNLNEIYKAKEKVKDVYVKGIKGITQVLPVKRGDEFVIITAGSNLKDVLCMDFVDQTRTTTNNIYEIEAILGIEAARQSIIDEVFKVIESQGLNVDVRHIMLIADTMCSSGKMKGITRYGIVSDKASILAKASFETPIKHIINAALVGESDKLTSVVENVMLNQPVPVGTGLPGLRVKQSE